MNPMIRVVSHTQIDVVEWSVEIDEYTPLRFRSSPGVVAGARHIRFGSGSSNVFYLTLAETHSTVVGFHLVSYHIDAVDKMVGRGKLYFGLPVIDLDSIVVSDFSRSRYIDTNIDFLTYADGNVIEVQFLQSSAFEYCIQCGCVDFLVGNGNLVGIRVSSHPKCATGRFVMD